MIEKQESFTCYHSKEHYINYMFKEQDRWVSDTEVSLIFIVETMFLLCSWNIGA